MSSSSSFPHNHDAAALPEGYGAPISIVNKRIGDPIDPTLDSCCQRELEGNRQWNAVQVALKRHDRIARMERMRRNAVTLEGGVLACRCNFDPQSDGGDYEALRHLRLLVSLPPSNDDNAASSTTTDINNNLHDDDDNSSSDSDFDYLLDDLPVDKEFEEQQREELEEAIVTRDLLLQHGYGTMRQMHPLRVLRTAGLLNTDGGGGAVVLHLFDPTSDMSASLDMLLEKQSIHYKGTKFLRSDGRNVLKMNPSFRPVTENDMPALLAIHDGCVVATCSNLKGLGYAKVDENQTIYWLDRANVLIRDPPPEHMLCRISPDVDALLASGILKQRNQEDYFNCGVPGCQKTFYHEHVGIPTDEQDGLLVKQDGTVKDI